MSKAIEFRIEAMQLDIELAQAIMDAQADKLRQINEIISKYTSLDVISLEDRKKIKELSK